MGFAQDGSELPVPALLLHYLHARSSARATGRRRRVAAARLRFPSLLPAFAGWQSLPCHCDEGRAVPRCQLTFLPVGRAMPSASGTTTLTDVILRDRDASLLYISTHRLVLPAVVHFVITVWRAWFSAANGWMVFLCLNTPGMGLQRTAYLLLCRRRRWWQLKRTSSVMVCKLRLLACPHAAGGVPLFHRRRGRRPVPGLPLFYHLLLVPACRRFASRWALRMRVFCSGAERLDAPPFSEPRGSNVGAGTQRAPYMVGGGR